MDFEFTQSQKDISELAAKILNDLAPPERLPDFEEAVVWHDEIIWKALAQAGLLGVGLSEEFGGMGPDISDLGVLCEQVGVYVAPLSVIPTLVSARAIARFGSPQQRETYLGRVIGGQCLFATALEEADASDAKTPTTTARADGSGWRLSGTKTCVSLGQRAERILVSATITADGGRLLALVDPDSEGLTLNAQEVTSGELRYQLVFDNVFVEAGEILSDNGRGADVLKMLIDETVGLLCACELGVAQRALKMTAEYSARRKQFDKPIATFQAVAQRAANAFIDLEAMRVCCWQALWCLDTGQDAGRELSIAKFWAAEGGHNVCYAAQHLHGGIGVDTDYPLHRYYLLSRQIELTLGGAKVHLDNLGRMLAEHGARE